MLYQSTADAVQYWNDGFGELPRTTTSGESDLVYETRNNLPGIHARRIHMRPAGEKEPVMNRTAVRSHKGGPRCEK